LNAELQKQKTTTTGWTWLFLGRIIVLFFLSLYVLLAASQQLQMSRACGQTLFGTGGELRAQFLW
jgi:hypothetical protein